MRSVHLRPALFPRLLPDWSFLPVCPMTQITRPFTALSAGCCWLAVAVTSSPLLAQSSPANLWQTDVAGAAKLARRLKRPLLIHFYASWCRPCRKLERETFPSPRFRRQVAGKFVLVKVNADRNPRLVKEYGVTGLPTDVLVSPGGRILSRRSGYDSREKYLAHLGRWERRYVGAAKLQVVGNRPPARVGVLPSRPRVKQPPERGSIPAARTPKRRMLIGMDGYSPVAMHRQRKWIAGRPKFAWRYQGMTYWLANETEYRDFKADPRKFAPRLLGCDPVVLNETDRAVRGRIQFGALFDGALYFFVSAASRTKFRAHPLHYTRTRHVLRIDRIEGTVLR